MIWVLLIKTIENDISSVFLIQGPHVKQTKTKKKVNTEPFYKLLGGKSQSLLSMSLSLITWLPLTAK